MRRALTMDNAPRAAPRAFSSNLTALSARAYAHSYVHARTGARARGAPGPEIARPLEYRTHTERARAAVALCGTLKEHNVHSPAPTMGPPQLVNIKVV